MKYSDGWYQGVQYFQSGVKKGHFLPLVALHPDQRQEGNTCNYYIKYFKSKLVGLVHDYNYRKF